MEYELWDEKSTTDETSNENSLLLAGMKRKFEDSETVMKLKIIEGDKDSELGMKLEEEDSETRMKREIEETGMKLKTEGSELGMKLEKEESDSESESEDESESEEYEMQVEVEDWYEYEEIADILIDGEHFSNERLLDCMTYKDGDYAYRRTNKFLNKVRRYLKSVVDSDGFDISDWPGNISGLTHIVPKDYLMEERVIYPEGYKYVMCLSDMAIRVYNNHSGTNFYVESVEKVNSRMVQGYTYYITFTASDKSANDECAFQAKVWDDVTHGEIYVLSCNLKPT